MSFLGRDAPKLSELQQPKTHRHPPPEPRPQKPTQAKPKLPHHVKDVVASVSHEALHAISSKPPRLKEAYLKAMELLGDDMLEAITKREAARASPAAATRASRTGATATLIDLLKIQLADDQQAQENSSVFDSEETAKARLRVLMNTYGINGLLTKEDLAGIKLPNSPLLRSMATDTYFVSLDAQAFFDQLPIPRAARRWFRFRSKNKLYEACVLPMGYRGACDIAQGVAELLLAFDMPNVRSCAYIDNFYFSSSSKEDIIAALLTFWQRCEQVGLALNVPEVCITEELKQAMASAKEARGTATYPAAVAKLRQLELEALRTNIDKLLEIKELDVLGEHFDRTNQTRACTVASIEKLQAAKALVDYQDSVGLISRRNVAAIYGITLYATRVLDVSPAAYFNAMLAFRRLASTTSPTAWDETAPRLPPLARDELRAWCDKLLTNTPVPLSTPHDTTASQTTVFTDASAYGYGAVVLYPDGTSKTISHQWTAAEHQQYDLHSSVVAEPRAVQLLMAELFSSAPEAETPCPVWPKRPRS